MSNKVTRKNSGSQIKFDPLLIDVDEITQEWFSNQIKPQRSMKEHQLAVDCVQFNPTKETELMTGGHDHQLKRWDLTRGVVTDSWVAHKEGVWTMQYTNDGNQLVTGSPDSTVILWNLQSKKPQTNFKAYNNKIYHVEFSEDQQQLAVCGELNGTNILDVKKNSVVANLPCNLLDIYFCLIQLTQSASAKRVYCVKFSKDNKFIVTCDSDMQVIIYDRKTFKIVNQSAKFVFNSSNPNIEENRAYSLDLDFSPNSKSKMRIFVGYQQNLTKVYNFNIEKNILSVSNEYLGHFDSVKYVTLQSQLGLYATSANDGTVRLWNSENDKFQASLLGHKQTVSGIAFGPQNQRILATSSWDQCVNIYRF